MSVDISVRFNCDGCGKKMDVKATVRQGKRRQYYDVPNVFIVDNNMGDPENGEDDLRVLRNVTSGMLQTCSEEEGRYSACSTFCVIKIITKCMEKIK